MTTLITNIRQLLGVREENKLLRGKELANLPSIENAYLIIEDGIIVQYGEMSSIHNSQFSVRNSIDATGRLVLPCWCDSHTHLVFAASREEEFVDKIKGMSYAEIAAKGGGILNSAKKLNQLSEDQLFDLSWKRLEEISRLGTGAVEIKSGYGLTVDGELKMMRVIKRLKEKSNVSIKSTFLGAHAYPLEYRDNHKQYIDTVVNEMLPAISNEKLADYIDVFCETGFFSASETALICEAGMKYGLKTKLHVNQLSSIGGIDTAIKLNAVSVDHLEITTEDEVIKLRNANTIATLLPSAAFFLRAPFPPARKFIDAGCAIALASDYNPGSSPSGNMNLVVAMACIQMRMLPEEAINAATIQGAYAMELENETGTVAIGKMANLILTKPVSSISYLPYAFGSNLVDKVLIKGEFVM